MRSPRPPVASGPASAIRGTRSALPASARALLNGDEAAVTARLERQEILSRDNLDYCHLDAVAAVFALRIDLRQ